MLLNLLHNDWLTRLRATRESAVIILVSVLVGFGLALLKPIPGAIVGTATVLAVTIGGILLPLKSGLWFPWATVAGVIVPGAWVAALASYKNEVRRRASYSEYAEPLPLPAGGTEPLEVIIPEFVLIKRIGRGAYGEVWLGRNRVGLYYAIKIVFRKSFPEGVPYEREFRGIRKYMPISLRHPGLVRLLQVGRNDPLAYFYYVMELGDDETSGADIDPEKYSPRNLAKDLHKRGRLTIAETVVMALALSEPLEYLHKKGLLHRDIKPSNIIFVDGIPKLADIGLVTDITPREGVEASYVGTEGYVDPAGASKPTSDIYSFGKVLYEAATGLDRRQFPALPDWVNEEGGAVAEFMALNSVILKCCDTNPRKRYQSVTELHEALLDIERRIAKAPVA
jgi:serine/threonine protein kinase